MSFATAKELPASKKTTLIRIEHKKNITGLLGSSGSPNFTYTIDHPVEPYAVKFRHNGNPDTETNADSFSWDSGVLTFKIPAAKADMDMIMVYSYIFLTDGYAKYLDRDDPTGSISTVAEWLPYLLSSPTVSQDSSDIIEGQISIASSVFIVKDDAFFGDFLSENDSFYFMPISIWFGVDDNYELFYEGVIEDHSSTPEKITFKIKSPLKKLNQTAFLGDDISDCVLRRADYSGIKPEDEGRPIPFYYSTSYYRSTSKRTVAAAYYYEFPDVVNCPQVLGTVWSGEFIYPRDGIIGRFPHAINDETITFTSHSASTDAYSQPTVKVVTTEAQVKKLVLGCKAHMTYTGIAANQTVIEIVYNGSSSYFVVQDEGSVAILPLLSVLRRGLQLFSTRSDDVEYRPKYYDPIFGGYTATSTLLSSGHYLWSFSSIGSFVESQGQPHCFIAFVDTPTTHADALDEIVSTVGITANSTSLTNADSDFVADAYFTIPQYGVDEYPSVLELIQNITSSTLSTLYLDVSNELHYDIIGSISAASVDHSVTDLNIIEGSLSRNTKYQDIYTKYDLSNTMHGDGRWEGFGSSVSGTNLPSEYLYGIDKTYKRNHYLSTIPSTNETDIKNYISNQRIWWKFSLTIKFIDIQINDIVEITSDDVNGGVATKMLVLQYNKSIDKINVSCLELTI